MDDATKAFQDFERNGWNEVASSYAAVSDRVTAGAADPLLDAVGVSVGDRVLDIASGPGWVAAAAHRRGATAVGVDLSTQMVAEASARFPEVRFEHGAAEDLPFEDASFDVVVSAFGMPHFADHAAVFEEVHRVLAPAGRVGVASWNAPPENPFFAVAMGAIAAHGDLDVALPQGVDMFTWAEDAPCAELFASTGFGEHVRVQVPLELTTDDGPGTVVDVLENSTVRTRALFLAQTDEARAAISESLGELLEPFRSGDTWSIPLNAFVLTAGRLA